MTEQPRFLFDECIGKPLMLQLQQAVNSQAQFVHICDYFQEGVLDPDWIPKLSADGGFVVITADGGKKSKRGEKLPALCRENRVTHIILSAKLHHKKSSEKLAALLAAWEKIEAAMQSPVGSRFNLRYKQSKGGVLSIALVKA